MKKPLIYFLILTVFMTNFQAVFAAKRTKAKLVTYSLQTDSFEEEKEANINEDKVYLRVSKRDF